MAKIPREVKNSAIAADCFRFPQSADFERSFSYPSLTVEEIAALSCDRDPKVLNAKRIAEFRLSIPHPALARTRQDLMDFSALANAYEQRRDFLLRACRRRDLEAVLVGDTYEISLADFFPWLDRQGGKDPWDLLPDAFEERVNAFRDAKDTRKEKAAPSSPAAADSDSADNAEAGNGKSSGSSLGVSKDKKGPEACRAYLRTEMRKSFEDAAFSGQAQYRPYCTKRFDISGRAFDRIWNETATETDCTWAKRGRRRKAA